ncbi:MAG: asparaginase [Pseudomonadota bacterium]
MTDANPVLAEIWRGPVLECVHRGTAVVCRPDGEVVAAWGDPARRVLPRSSCKMVQALPLVESGAADAAGLTDRHLALACASHQGAAVHTDLAGEWLAHLGLGEPDLRCGPQIPDDGEARHGLRARGEAPCQLHNNCSGKHSGMLTLNQHLGGEAEYLEVEHPVQRAVAQVTAETHREELGDHAIDGCSAPNFVVSLQGLATAMAGFARPEEAFTSARIDAAHRLRNAMIAHPVLVAGDKRACTKLMRATGAKAAVKTGAEGVFVGILPEAGLGIALKIDDGSTRGSHAAITALLARYEALDREDPVYLEYAYAPLLNRRDIDCGRIRAAPDLLA